MCTGVIYRANIRRIAVAMAGESLFEETGENYDTRTFQNIGYGETLSKGQKDTQVVDPIPKFEKMLSQLLKAFRNNLTNPSTRID